MRVSVNSRILRSPAIMQSGHSGATRRCAGVTYSKVETDSMDAESALTAAATHPAQAHRRGRLIGWAVLIGGMPIMVGAALPWLTFFAGLQAYSGLAGLNGRLLMGGGVLALLLGIWFLRRRSQSLRWAIGLYGFALLAFASWLMVGLLISYRQLSADPMMVAGLSPGLFVAVAGALLVFAALFLDT